MTVSTASPKLKKDGTPKKSGGKRPGTGRPMKTPPDGWATWEQQLDRAKRLAANHPAYILDREFFFSKREVKLHYGEKALEEFNRYFKSIRQFDRHRMNVIRQKEAAGLYKNPPASWPEKALGHYTPEKYANWLIREKCNGWVTQLKDEYWADFTIKYSDHGRVKVNRVAASLVTE